MKKKSILLLAICVFAVTAIASAMVDLQGSWSFSVEQTMPEYRKGKLVFEEAEDEGFTGKIVFESGRTISMSSVDVEADTVTFKAYVDGGLVTTVCTLQEDELIGSVRTPDGMLPFLATREE